MAWHEWTEWHATNVTAHTQCQLQFIASVAMKGNMTFWMRVAWSIESLNMFELIQCAKKNWPKSKSEMVLNVDEMNALRILSSANTTTTTTNHWFAFYNLPFDIQLFPVPICHSLSSFVPLTISVPYYHTRWLCSIELNYTEFATVATVIRFHFIHTRIHRMPGNDNRMGNGGFMSECTTSKQTNNMQEEGQKLSVAETHDLCDRINSQSQADASISKLTLNAGGFDGKPWQCEGSVSLRTISIID